MNRGSFLKGLLFGGAAMVVANTAVAKSTKSENTNDYQKYKDGLKNRKMKCIDSIIGMYNQINMGLLISYKEAIDIRNKIDEMYEYGKALDGKHSMLDNEINHLGYDWQRIYALTVANTYVMECEPKQALYILDSIGSFNSTYPFTFRKDYPNSTLPQNCFMRENWDGLGRTLLQYGEKDLAIICFERSLEYGKNPVKKLISDLESTKNINVRYTNPHYETFMNIRHLL